MKERQQYTEKYTDVHMIRVRRVLRPMAFLRASLGLLFRRGPELLPGVCRIFLVLHSLLDRVPLGHGEAMFWVRPERLCFPGTGGRFKHTGAK